MNKKRPVNLQLTTIRFPATAIVSILHRISGVILFLFLPVMLWILSLSLSSAEGFNALQTCLAAPGMKFILWVMLSALAYHLVAGIRHLLMDFGWGEEKRSGKISAFFAMGLATILVILLGVLIW